MPRNWTRVCSTAERRAAVSEYAMRLETIDSLLMVF
jgi:hypothetical protein